MRHQKRTHKLNRSPSHRQALWRNQATALLRHETIRTTLAKAKALRSVIEPLVTLAKKGTLHARRLAHRRIRDQEVLHKLFGEIGPRFRDRAGGYTRVLKSGFRSGDNSPMAVIQFVGPQDKRSGNKQSKPSKAAKTDTDSAARIVEAAAESSDKPKELPAATQASKTEATPSAQPDKS